MTLSLTFTLRIFHDIFSCDCMAVTAVAVFCVSVLCVRGKSEWQEVKEFSDFFFCFFFFGFLYQKWKQTKIEGLREREENENCVVVVVVIIVGIDLFDYYFILFSFRCWKFSFCYFVNVKMMKSFIGKNLILYIILLFICVYMAWVVKNKQK